MDYKNKNFAILGFGVEGESVANFLLEKGATVSIFDVRDRETFDQNKISEFESKGVSFQFSYPEDFTKFDYVVRSPGVSTLSSVIEKVKKQGVKVTSAVQMFLDLCPCPVIGVTGTDGKTTTSSLQQLTQQLIFLS